MKIIINYYLIIIFIILIIIFIILKKLLFFFKKNNLSINQMNKLRHLGLIMDGNRRWGKKNKTTNEIAYNMGAKSAINLIQTFLDEKISEVTFYALSKDNFEKRPKAETDIIFNIAFNVFEEKKNWFVENRISIKIVGQKFKLDEEKKLRIRELEALTDSGDVLKINILFIYDYLDDIIYSINKMKDEFKDKEIDTNIFKDNFDSYKNVSNIDYLIRTGSSNRISGFMPLQLAYSELKFLDIFWPEINKNILLECINEYKTIKRNFGR